MPIRRWSRHSGESRDTLIQQLNSTEVPRSRHQRTGSKTGYGDLNTHPTLWSAFVYVLWFITFNYPIISLSTCELWFTFNQFVKFYIKVHVCTLIMFYALSPYHSQQINKNKYYNHTFQMNGRGIRDYNILHK